MINLSNFELQSLIKLAKKEAERTENYLSVMGEGEDEEDERFYSEQLAQIAFFKSLAEKLESLLNEQ